MEGFRPITQWNEDDRPREKLMNKGRSALSDAELLAILLNTGTKHRDAAGNILVKTAVDLGKDILHQAQNSLLNLSRMGVSELTKLPGIGEAKAISIVAALELGARRKASKEEKTKITCSKDAYDVLAPNMQDLLVEEFWVLLLNRANMVNKVVRLSQGGSTGTVIDSGTLFKIALLENAKGIILSHNHPSGNLVPSEQDIQITRKLKQNAQLLDMQILDHLIIGSQGYYSFGDEGTL